MTFIGTREILSPLVTAPLPFSTRVSYAVRLWALKILVKCLRGFAKVLKSKPVCKRPTYIKKYPVRSMIRNRIFIPKSYKAGDRALPLYINIHGGGFALPGPDVDDDFARRFANKHSICVVSIGYRRAPRYFFPYPVHDCAALAEAVLDDPDLPIDRKKTAIGGFSAGGNLALGAIQADGLKGRVSGVVGFYPIVDFARPVAQKLKDRPSTPGKKDVLAGTGSWFTWAYIPQDTDRTNPLLSPIFAKKEDLPPKICLIGCELDMLCKEAQDMAEDLAETEDGPKKDFADGVGWEKGGVRWEKVVGEEHAFDHSENNGEGGAARRKRAEELHDGLAQWLFREVYV